MLSKINKKIGKSLEKSLEGIRRKQMFCKAAVLEAHAVHITYIDFAD